MKFLADEMLGDIARWLRIMGYDVEYAKDKKDDEIIDWARREGRIILTQDEGMKASDVEIYVVKGKSFEEKMIDIIKHFNLGIEAKESRCALCNGKLKKIKKEDVKGKVPPKVYENFDEFWICERCGQVYWEGSHWKRIRHILQRLKERLNS